eukprot:TRINITY_DN2677_c0_g1_i1.p1 TRINITY_DN2677_c0_g1~~TRINITY_DN2677_c0_g1_i1.p1  ORF type:complete len:146 (+),score=39.16 TRINITY_DN2677_c0_g1_i1:34-471(+)
MVMLKNIPTQISPDLMHALMSMGHGDELVLADGNFPAASHAKILIRADGLSASSLLDAILTFLPLDTFAEDCLCVMKPVNPQEDDPSIWAVYEASAKKHDKREIKATQIERFAFYERAKKAYAIVATSETALYANVILKKGIIVS